MAGVKEWSDVQAQARESRKTIHVGMSFLICVEKNAELPGGSPNRKYKRRFAFQGNRIRGEESTMTLFQDLGTALAISSSQDA